MKVTIVGAGFTGIAAAWKLCREGHDVTILERSALPGGLAAGFGDAQWDWTLEHHYHHIFEQDASILELVSTMGLSSLVTFRKTRTVVFREGDVSPLDTPWALIRYPNISLWSRIRVGVVMLFLRLFPLWRVLEKFSAASFLRKTMGKQAWEVLWEPLFYGKFGDDAYEVNAAWFWARIHVRSQALGYFEGGFGRLAERMVGVLKAHGVVVQFDSTATVLEQDEGRWKLSYSRNSKRHDLESDVVLVTGPHTVLQSLYPLPDKLKDSIGKLRGLAAQTLVLELDEEFFSDETYWMNINQADWPFLAVVEHTHFMDPVHYGGKHLVYVGDYLATNDSAYGLNAQDLLERYHPYLEQLSPDYASHVVRSWLFKAPFAQPIPFVNQSMLIPPTRVVRGGIYWASMQHVYPWDRGTNYAVSLGNLVADQIMKDAL